MAFNVQAEAPPLREDATGALRVGKSRVLLELVVRAFQNGAKPETIVQRYSTLALPDVYAVLAYYLRHPNEVEEYLARREQKAEEVEQRIESCNRVRGLTPRSLPLVILFLSVAVCGGCSSSSNKANSKPTPKLDDPKTHAARQEEDFQAYGSDIEGGLRTEARHAVLDFVKESLPGWNVKGMACQLREMSIFSIDADLEKQGKHAVITFDTRKFFPESGDPYWLAVPVNKFRLDRLHDLTDAGKAKELQDAEDTIDQLRTPSAPDKP